MLNAISIQRHLNSYQPTSAAAPSTTPSQPTDSVSIRGAFREGVGEAASFITRMAGGVVGAGVGYYAGTMLMVGVGALVGASLSGVGGLAMLWMGASAVAGAFVGARAAKKADNAVGNFGARHASRIGASELTGRTAARGLLAAGLTAPLSVPFAAATVSGATVTSALMLAGGALNKAVSWVTGK